MVEDLTQSLLQMQSLINSSRQGGGGGKQGWADGMINKGAQTITSAHGGGGFKLPAFGGSGNGLFGQAGGKPGATLAAIGDAFLKSISGPTGIQAPQIQEANIGEFNHGLGRSNGGGGSIDLG